MHDPRIDRLADILLDHSCRLQSSEKVLIEAFDLPDPTLVCRLIEGAARRGGVPLVSWKSKAGADVLSQPCIIEEAASRSCC